MYYRGVVSRLRVFSPNLCSIVVWRVWIDSRWTFYVPLVNVWTPDATDRCCSPCCVGLAAGVCVWWQVCGDSSVCAIHHPLDRAECFWDRFERWYENIGRNQVYRSFISIRGELFRKYPKIRDYSSLALDFYLHRIVSRSRKWYDGAEVSYVASKYRKLKLQR